MSMRIQQPQFEQQSRYVSQNELKKENAEAEELQLEANRKTNQFQMRKLEILQQQIQQENQGEHNMLYV